MGKKVITNLIWRFLERTGAQLVSFVVSIILARILAPEEYGIVAITIILISFFNVFIDNGLGNALIQKKDCDDLDFSTSLWSNLLICIMLYGVIFAIAPLIADFYNCKTLVSVTRVMGLSIIVSGIKNIQQAYISRKLQFKKFFYATLSGTIVSAIVGIVMAYYGCGVWALVAQYLVNILIDTCVLSIIIDWRPKCHYSLERFRVLFQYGYKLFLSSMINCIYDNFRQLIVGRLYSSTDLAYYNRGKQFPSLAVVNINNSIDSVIFPVLSMKQDDNQQLCNMVKRSLTTSAMILFPILSGMAITAEHFIPLLLTEKWNSSIVFVRVFCMLYLTYPLQTTNLNVIKAMGNSTLFLRLEIVQTIAGVFLLVPAIHRGPLAIAMMYMIASVFNFIVISNSVGKIIGYRFRRQMKDISPYLIMSIIMCGVVWIIGRVFTNHWVVILQVLIGMIIYIIMLLVFRPEAFTLILSMIEKRRTEL